MPTLETCPDCKIVLPRVDMGGHAYLGASPSCWAMYGEVLAREYGDAAYMAVHRLTVDAYCAQHPGKPSHRTIQSINVHLAGLYLTVERRLSGAFARRVIGGIAARSATLTWLEPPASLGTIHIDTMFAADDARAHATAVERWATSVWDAWREWHGRIADMAEAAARQV